MHSPVDSPVDSLAGQRRSELLDARWGPSTPCSQKLAESNRGQQQQQHSSRPWKLSTSAGAAAASTVGGSSSCSCGPPSPPAGTQVQDLKYQRQQPLRLPLVARPCGPAPPSPRAPAAAAPPRPARPRGQRTAPAPPPAEGRAPGCEPAGSMASGVLIIRRKELPEHPPPPLCDKRGRAWPSRSMTQQEHASS